MAQRVKVSLVDDIDGGEAEENVRFGVDGKHYEIDLSAQHAEKLRAALSPYVGVARRVRASTVRPDRRPPAGRRSAPVSTPVSTPISTPVSTPDAVRTADERPAVKEESSKSVTVVPAAQSRTAPSRPAVNGATRTVDVAGMKLDKAQRAAIRTWGKRKGYAVGDRGRLPEEVIRDWVMSGRPSS